MKNQKMENQYIKTQKNEIRDLGCASEIHSEIHSIPPELWITHLETGWRSYVRLPSGGKRWQGLDDIFEKTMEDCWRDAVEIARYWARASAFLSRGGGAE